MLFRASHRAQYRLQTLYRNLSYNASPSATYGRMESSKQDKQRSGKLRGSPRDDARTRMSKTLSYTLRHGAKNDGIAMRSDGYVSVKDLLSSPKFSALDFSTLESIVQQDKKQRYHMLLDPSSDESSGVVNSWWIRANQGHSLKDVNIDGKDILSASEIPMAVHGTNMNAWPSISKQGLSRMSRNHIHLAQSLAGKDGVSGMRKSADVFIYIDVQKAIDAGFKFLLSTNGVVLTEGNEFGFLPTEFFQRVERRFAKTGHQPIPGWEGTTKDDTTTTTSSEQVPEVLETNAGER